MRIGTDAWLAAILAKPVFKVGFTEAPTRQDWGQLQSHIQQQQQAFYFAKVATSDIAQVQQLGNLGFFVVDVNVLFQQTCDRFPLEAPSASSAVKVEPITPAQHQAVLEIAATSFRYSRFNLDPLIPEAIAHQIKHDWVLNYIKGGRGDQLFVATVEEQPAGFLAALTSQTTTGAVATIDLLAVSSRFQRQGIGTALVKHFIDYYQKSCPLLQIGTQVANIPSMQLYAKAGFLISSTSYLLHLHVQDGQKVSHP